MHLYAVWAGVLACVPALVSAARVPQGPKITTLNGASEVYAAGGRELAVLDFDNPIYSPIPLRPTIVYNCAYMPSICNNVRNFIGHLPVRGTPYILHYDPDPGRNTARRDAACGRNWVNILVNGKPRCPEADQPKWTGYRVAEKHGPYDVEIHPSDDGTSFNRLSSSWVKIDIDELGAIEQTTVWDDYETVISCDEFPPASTIEGGAAGDGVAKATEYCAPIMDACNSARGKRKTAARGKRKRADRDTQNGVMTDQNWQSEAHSRLTYLLPAIAKALGGRRGGIPNPKSVVSRFNLVTINDADEAHASWVEANGVKRYCVGPGDADNRGCDKSIVKGRDYN